MLIETAFRDALLVHLALIPSPPTTETLVAKLVQAGSTLEFLRYNEQLFEILFIGGLLQPGGSYLDDKRSPVYLLKSEGEWDGVKGMVEVLKRVIQRYKYLQKPLEEDFLPNILGYLGKWSAEDREKLAEATALFIIELQSSPKCLGSLTKEHVSKDGVALSFITSFFKAYLARQNVEHLSATLKRSGLRDLLLLFPIQTRDRKHLEDHFKKENLTPILDWYNKLALSEVKDETILNITRMVNDDEGNEQVSRPAVLLKINCLHGRFSTSSRTSKMKSQSQRPSYAIGSSLVSCDPSMPTQGQTKLTVPWFSS